MYYHVHNRLLFYISSMENGNMLLCYVNVSVKVHPICNMNYESLQQLGDVGSYVINLTCLLFKIAITN
jgi:hypothetical protein